MTCLQAMCFWRSAPLPAARWSWPPDGTGHRLHHPVHDLQLRGFRPVPAGPVHSLPLHGPPAHVEPARQNSGVCRPRRVYLPHDRVLRPHDHRSGGQIRPVPLPQLAARRPQQRHHRLKRCLVGPGAQGLCDLSDQTHHPGVQPRCGGPLALSRAVVCLWLARHDHRIGPGGPGGRGQAYDRLFHCGPDRLYLCCHGHEHARRHGGGLFSGHRPCVYQDHALHQYGLAHGCVEP